MIWLPVQWKSEIIKSLRPYEFVLVDECQDLNAAQLELSCMLAGVNGRMLFVGDPHQAIVGFAGADCDSYQEILKRIKGTDLPLSVCYRCPRSHIELVKMIFPNISFFPAPTASLGKIIIISETQFKETKLTDKDLIISRKTAPLVSLCIRLIASGIAAIVKGREIGESLYRILEEVDKLNFPFEQFTLALELYHAAQTERFLKMDNAEQLIELLKDKIAAIYAIYGALPMAKNIWDLKDYIDTLFSDNSNGLVTLCTCHRAKGSMELHWQDKTWRGNRAYPTLEN
ncbi:MAG: UvrD-helicase domain-containing protein [Hormoscilla sp. GM102CHS1]|nr:UvrD-helicase domain-containing protein [Hormoscilla sp. GM102CHS1]